MKGDGRAEENKFQDWVNGHCDLDNEIVHDNSIINATTHKPENDRSSYDKTNETGVIPKVHNIVFHFCSLFKKCFYIMCKICLVLDIHF